jgi:hypothetical protein
MESNPNNTLWGNIESHQQRMAVLQHILMNPFTTSLRLIERLEPRLRGIKAPLLRFLFFFFFFF